MPIKATVRRPAPPVAAPAPAGAPGGPALEVESSAHTVDEASPEELAKALESGAPIPGSDEEAEQASRRPAAPTALPAPRAAAPQQPSRYSDASGGGLEGDFDEKDIRLPQLKIVNGSGELAQKFNQGTLLYADERLWIPPDLEDSSKNPVMTFVPVQVRKQWRENLSDEEVKDGDMPRVVDTVAEAEAFDGPGCCEWGADGVQPRWKPSARCIFLLQAPPGCTHPGFCNELDGGLWAAAVYYASGTAYNETAKEIFNRAKVALCDPSGRITLHKKLWTFKVFKKQFTRFGVYLPKLTLTKDLTGPDVCALALDLARPGRNIQAQE